MKSSELPRYLVVRFLPVLILIAVSLQGAGCSTVGFKSFSHDGTGEQHATAKLKGISFAYKGDKYLSPEVAFALEKCLRERYHVVDIQPLAPNGSPADRNTVLIRIHSSGRYSLPGQVMMVLNFLSAAIVPATWSETTILEFTLTSPDGEKFFRYSWSERVYSWLPMILFGPKYALNLNAEMDQYQPERIRVLDDIMTRFLDEAAPFILFRSSGIGV
jgi:hypothetical protein